MREKKRAERYVLLIYFFYCMILTSFAIGGVGPIWLVFVADGCLMASVHMHIRRYRNYAFRAYLTASLMQINMVFWSIASAGYSMMLPMLSALTVILGLYRIPEIIYITVAATTFLNIYHILIVQTISFTSVPIVLKTVLEVSSLYIVEFFVFYLVKKQLESTEKQRKIIDSLKAAERSKDDFLANVSHEIRTPINTICGMSEIVLREELADTVRADVFSIQAAGRNLLSVVSDVLDFSELQSGKMELAEETYNITSTVNDIINMSMARKSKKKIELIVDCNADIPSSLVGDEQKIRRVIMNLVNNALKFTEEGCVSIMIDHRNTDYGINLIVRVKDTGIGMQEESLEKLFTSFNQVDAKRNRQEGGIGLGLAISRAMVDKMGGFITVESEYGVGSAIQFVIPQKVLDHTPIVTVHDVERLNVAIYIDMEQFERIEIRDEYYMVVYHLIERLKVKSHLCQSMGELKRRVGREIYSHIFISIVEYEEDRGYFDKISQTTKVVAIIDRSDDARIENPKILRLYKPLFILPIVMVLNDEAVVQNMEQGFHNHGRFIAPDANVLAVDDNLMNIRVLEGLLRPYKIKVSMATSGAEALEKIETMDYDFVFMDHMMPEMDGIETLHRIRQKPGNYFKKIPVIALTANAIGGMREVFLSEGFQDFMAKPIEISVLERVLRRNLPQEKIMRIDRAASTIQQDETEETSIREEKALEEERFHTDLPPEFFDEAVGMRYCGGLQNYIDVLRITSRDGQEQKNKMQHCFDTQNWKDYTIYVHALKSTMLNIGVKQLSDMAKELEMAGKRDDITFISEHHDAMMMEYAQVLNIMKDSHTVCPVADKEAAGALEPLEEGTLDSLALEFEDAAFAFDADKMAAIADRLLKCSYHGHPLKEQVETVMHKIEMSDYMSASDVVARLKDKFV